MKHFQVILDSAKTLQRERGNCLKQSFLCCTSMLRPTRKNSCSLLFKQHNIRPYKEVKHNQFTLTLNITIKIRVLFTLLFLVSFLE